MDVTIEDFFRMKFETPINNEVGVGFENGDMLFPKDAVIDYVCSVCKIPYADFLQHLIENPPTHSYDTSRITQSSKIENCHVNFCKVYQSHGLYNGLNTKMLGEYLLADTPHSQNEVALRRYGRDQAFSAMQLGLAKLIGKEWYLTCLGVVFLDVDEHIRFSLMARTLLRDSFYSKIFYKALLEDVMIGDFMNCLQETTMRRRCKCVMKFVDIAKAAALPGTFHNFVLPQYSK